MQRLRVESFSISVDGFGAGPNQDLDNPLGVGGTALHGWAWPTETFQRTLEKTGGTTGIDNDYAKRGFENIGAWIMGRNMFGPIRGPWKDHVWRGWWGDNPPYHSDVFVLTHHKRPPLEMAGGTTFYFTSDPIEDVLDRAFVSAHGKDVRLGGGVNAIRQFLRARLVDEMHFAISPVLLGSGERLFEGVDLNELGYRCSAHRASDHATHVILSRS